MAHTPGPWFEHREGFSTVYIEARIGGGMLQEVAACGPTEAGQEQQSANARLIAAAPDLLEAVKLFIEYDDHEESTYAAMMIRYNKALSAAKSAIEKAEGKQ